MKELILPIKLAEDTIDNTELENLSKWILTTKQLTKGPLTIEFEKKFSAYIGCKYSVFVNSGSSANLVIFYALLASKKLRNKKVIVPAVSWITTLAPALQLGYEIILCDSDNKTLGLDLNHLEDLCKTHNPGLVITVDVLGHANNYIALETLKDRYNFEIIVDGCESLGTTFKDGKKVGTFGLATSFSFYFGHHISTIEGGMVTTNDEQLYNLFLSIRSHGWSRDLAPHVQEEWKKSHEVDNFRNYYTFYHAGFNLRSTDLNAFLGLSQLDKLPTIVETRERNFLLYKKYIDKAFWCQESDYIQLSSFAYATFVENRIETADKLKESQIECRPLICGSMGRQPFYIEKFGVSPLLVADKVHYNGLYLPNHLYITEARIKYISEVFNKVAIPIKV